MHHRRAGPLYSPLGCGAAVLLIMILTAILYFQGGGPFSPGPLSAASPRNVPLEGFTSHAEFEGDCSLCHEPIRGVTTGRCENCHKDVAEQRKTDKGLHGLMPNVGRCQICHTDHNGREATTTFMNLSTFDHDRLTRFSLARHSSDYGGMAIACEDCHPANQFDVAKIDCIDCHTAGDAAFMAKHAPLFGHNCLACHDGSGSGINFDHEQVFPLDGAHAQVECNACHLLPIVEGTPDDCVGCHPEPPVHAGVFGTDCVRCHTTSSWLPAQLTQHTFPLDHGDEGQIACETCHTESYVDHTCYNCHAHDPAETEEEHIEEGIFEFEDCVACHPTGRKEEVDG
jgi:hypothetical protein